MRITDVVTSVAALLFLLLAASGCAAVFRKRIEIIWPLCYCGCIVWLYLFYICGLVSVGLVLFCIASAALFAAGWRKKGAFRAYLHEIISPGNVVYLCICLIYIAFLTGNYVSRHDELRLWGAVPKAIHATGALQLGKNSPIFSTMQSYPPALPLIGYFFTAFSRSFSEGALYVAYACMSISFFLPALAEWEWKHWKLLAPAGLLIMLTPMFFTSHFWDGGLFGMTLFVDPLLGIVMGYCLYLAGKRPQEDSFQCAAFGLSLAVLCLLKNTGVVFAIAATCVAFSMQSTGCNRRNAVPLLAIGGSIGTWRLLLSLHNVHDLVGLHPHVLTREEIQNVLHAMVSRNMVAYGVPLGFLLSFVAVYAALWVVYAAVFRGRGEQEKKKAVRTAWGFLGSAAAYLYGYALIYGKTLESFQRYMAALLLGLAVYILLEVLPVCIRWKLSAWICSRKQGFSIAAASACLLIALGAMAAWQIIFSPLPYRELADQDAETIGQAVRYNLAAGETGRVYLVMAGDGYNNSHYHHRVFFKMISKDVNIGNGLGQTQVVIPGLENPAMTWADELKEGYNFVYLLSVEDALKPVFKELSQGEPEPHALYRVESAENEYGISLHRVPDKSF